MLRLEAPRDLLQITDRMTPPEQALQLANPAVWVRTMAHQQKQSEKDLRQITELCGNKIDRTDQQMIRIEEAYQTLAEGTRYIYDRVNANEEIAENCTDRAGKRGKRIPNTGTRRLAGHSGTHRRTEPVANMPSYPAHPCQ